MDEVKKLALEISSCAEVAKAFRDSTHPCHKVVDWQAKEWSPAIHQIENSKMHRPEAWTGNISKAPIMFISSNPSFDSGENFPNWEIRDWPIEKIEDFALNRFSPLTKRGYGATDGLTLDEVDRTIGKNGEILGKVTYWNWARNISAYIYGKNPEHVSAHSDYSMTEIVHCKSKSEKGVKEARSICKDRYFERILQHSAAKIVVVSGKHACSDMKAIYPDKFPADWGLWNQEGEPSGGYWPMTSENFEEELASGKWTFEAQHKHTVSFEVAGSMRTFIYFAKSGGGGGLNAPWKYSKLIDPNLLSIWREAINVH